MLVTGAAGFIGFHVAARLLAAGHRVVGLDNLDPYYDPALKRARLEQLSAHPHWRFVEGDVADRTALQALFDAERPERVVHLAAQAGVRHSITHPRAYGHANLTGFIEVLEACRHGEVAHLVYASSSSVYGGNTAQPLSEHAVADHPISLYAATKRANELMAHAYAHLYRLPCTGLRFFTVYGPWGRPDMALFLFTSAILEGRPIDVFGHGRLWRDFTYIDDIVDGVVSVLEHPAEPDPAFDSDDPDPARSTAPFRTYNIGANRPVLLTDLIDALERALGRKADRRMLPMQPGDVERTWADCSDLEERTGRAPQTTIEEGIERFVAWYRAYYAT